MPRPILAWSIFLLATFLFGTLSVWSFPPALQVTVFLLGIGLILWGAVWALPKASGGPPVWDMELWERAPGWVFGVLIFGVVLSRLYKLDSLFLWPSQDETDLGMFAIALSEKWDWKFFYTFGQVAPTPVWASALLLKLGVPIPLCLWIPSAIVSVATVLTAYAAARTFFSRSTALTLVTLFAFSFWPFYMGRICHQGVWVPLWVCLCLLFLGRTLRAQPGPEQNKEALALGLVTGSGFWTFTPWPAMALAVGLGLGGSSVIRSRFPEVVLGRFLPGFLIALLPFFNAILTEGYGQHVSAMFAGSGWNPWSHQAWTVLSYISELFWGCLESDPAYIAPNGGLLNPVLGGFFFLGLASLFRHRALSFSRWLALAFLLGSAPGLVSMNVETFRIAGVLPILLFITALGALELVSLLPRPHRGKVLAVLVAIGATGDAWRITRWQAPPPPANFRALDILRQNTARYGPGAVLTEFQADPRDESLFVLSYGSNAAGNPRIHQTPLWTGVVASADYRPFLEPRFPGALWYDLGRNGPGNDDLLLGIIPVRPENQKDLERWRTAHHYFRALSLAINSISEPRTYAKAKTLFDQAPSWISEDPWLVSCFWEKRAEFFYMFDFKDHYDDQCDALRKAVKGYPAFHLHYELGSLLMRRDHWDAAEKELRAAQAQRPGDASILNALKILQDQKGKAPVHGAFGKKLP